MAELTDAEKAARELDRSSPFPFPPLIFGIAVLVSFGLWWSFAWPIFDFGRWVFVALGLAVIAGGVAIAVAAGRLFTKAGTAVRPDKRTKVIVDTGIFAYTRNPMYLGMILVLEGLGLAMNSFWFWLAVPIAGFALVKLAIEREERYLTAKFGAVYTDYQARVRRWI